MGRWDESGIEKRKSPYWLLSFSVIGSLLFALVGSVVLDHALLGKCIACVHP